MPGFIRLDARADDEFFPQAQITGRLVKQDGCLLVDDLVAVWTADFSFSPGTETLEWPGGSARVGNYVEFGGGIEPLGSEREAVLLSEANVEAVADCTAATGAHWSYMTP